MGGRKERRQEEKRVQIAIRAGRGFLFGGGLWAAVILAIQVARL